MSSITIKNPSSHSQIPWEVQRELKGLTLPLTSPMRFAIVGPETVGAFELKRNYDAITENCYAVSRKTLLLVATNKDLHQIIAWVKETGVDMFFFTKDSCVYNP